MCLDQTGITSHCVVLTTFKLGGGNVLVREKDKRRVIFLFSLKTLKERKSQSPQTHFRLIIYVNQQHISSYATRNACFPDALCSCGLFKDRRGK